MPIVKAYLLKFMKQRVPRAQLKARVASIVADSGFGYFQDPSLEYCSHLYQDHFTSYIDVADPCRDAPEISDSKRAQLLDSLSEANIEAELFCTRQPVVARLIPENCSSIGQYAPLNPCMPRH